jgi:uncharacterized membrane protein
MIVRMNDIVLIRVRLRVLVVGFLLSVSAAMFGLSFSLTLFLPEVVWKLQLETLKNRQMIERLKQENDRLGMVCNAIGVGEGEK